MRREALRKGLILITVPFDDLINGKTNIMETFQECLRFCGHLLQGFHSFYSAAPATHVVLPHGKKSDRQMKNFLSFGLFLIFLIFMT